MREVRIYLEDGINPNDVDDWTDYIFTVHRSEIEDQEGWDSVEMMAEAIVMRLRGAGHEASAPTVYGIEGDTTTYVIEVIPWWYCDPTNPNNNCSQ